MKVCRICIDSREALASAAAEIGANAGSLPFFEAKRETLQLSVAEIPAAAANILKQEMLSAGGDAVVRSGCVNCSVATSRVLLLGSRKQLQEAAAKLKLMPWWGLPDIADEITACLREPKRTRTQLMAIINLTDDSFFAASRADLSQLCARAEQFLDEGADILDIGAESTRPGAERVAEDAELPHISTAVTQLKNTFPSVRISVDTTRTSVARAALENGAEFINDVSGLSDESFAPLCAKYGAKYILMHSRGTAKTMDDCCNYDNLLLDINSFFEQKVQRAEQLGMARENIILDPGFGFAKTAEQNICMLKNLVAFRRLGLPLLAGVSRKRFLGENLAADDRLPATLAATTVCALQGVEYVRVHDIAENRRVIDFCEVLR